MTEKKKTAFGVATTGSGSGKEITTDTGDYTKNCQKNQGIVEKYLLKGRENAIPGTKLAELIGIGTTRELQKMIASERLNGALILSSSEGYFLPSDGQKGREEIQRFVAQFRALALNTLKVLKTAKRALAIPEGQIEIECQKDQE